MLIRTCGYCGEGVDMAVGGHVHDPKVCQDCKQQFPISNFPVWKSSCDGHRHTCITCTKARTYANTARQREARQADRERERQLLNDHGYKWQPRMTHGEKTWVLLNPMGQSISKAAALDTIYASLYPEDDAPW